MVKVVCKYTPDLFKLLFSGIEKFVHRIYTHICVYTLLINNKHGIYKMKLASPVSYGQSEKGMDLLTDVHLYHPETSQCFSLDNIQVWGEKWVSPLCGL